MKPSRRNIARAAAKAAKLSGPPYSKYAAKHPRVTTPQPEDKPNVRP